jgi:hypothetical protein
MTSSSSGVDRSCQSPERLFNTKGWATHHNRITPLQNHRHRNHVGSRSHAVGLGERHARLAADTAVDGRRCGGDDGLLLLLFEAGQLIVLAREEAKETNWEGLDEEQAVSSRMAERHHGWDAGECLFLDHELG